MPTATESTTAIQDAIVSSIKQSQEIALSGVTAWADFTTKALPKQPFEALPFPTAVPEARELVDAGFEFAAEVLEVQKQFSIKLLEAVTPKQSTK